MSVAFSADSKSLASGSDDKTVKLWDMATGKTPRRWKGTPARSVSWPPALTAGRSSLAAGVGLATSSFGPWCRTNEQFGRHRSSTFEPERLKHESPGQRPGKPRPGPGQALKGRNKSELPTSVVPFQGELVLGLTTPRALPWADLFGPFRPQKTANPSAGKDGDQTRRRHDGCRPRHANCGVPLPEHDLQKLHPQVSIFERDAPKDIHRHSLNCQ